MPGSDSTARTIRRRRLTAILLLALFVGGLLVWGALLLGLFSTDTETQGTQRSRITVSSPALGKDRSVSLIEPSGSGAGRPLLVFLHGRGESAPSYLENEELLAALGRLGRRAPAIAIPDGGESSYWHNRDDGDWADYVIDDVIPTVTAEVGADPKRVAIGGISMGGFGAYSLALSNPGRFCAVGGHSPALWLEGGDSAPGAFDNGEDFERHDVLEQVAESPVPFGGIPVWNDIGEEDPFLISSVELAESLRTTGAEATTHVWPGGHDYEYWNRHWDAYLRFYAEALANCETAALR
jgi:S-formylglutathione hydrolase FrmB